MSILDRTAARVLVDSENQTVTASLGLDSSAPAVDILHAVCVRLQERLERLPGESFRLHLTIVHIAD